MKLTNKILLTLAFLCFGSAYAMEPEKPWALHDTISRKENIQTLRNLISRGYDRNQCNSDGHTSLLLACKIGNDEAAEVLLRNFYKIVPSLFIPDRHFFGYLPIHYICQYRNNAKLLNLMLLAAEEQNELPRLLASKDKLGNYPLHLAISSNRSELAKLLVQYGANMEARNQAGHTPMTLSVMQCEELLPWLLAKGANPDTTISNEHDSLSYADTGIPVLHLACRENRPNAVRLLLAHGANPNKIQDYNFSSLDTAAHIATRHKSSACIAELLMGPPINLNARNRIGNTPLHEACMVLQPELSVIKKLVMASRTSINALNDRDENPLTVLCNHKFNYDLPKIIRYLVSEGAERSYHCLHRAALINDTQMVEFLLKNGWDINAKDPQGNTVLHKLKNKLEQAKLTYFGNPTLIETEEEKVNVTIKFIEIRARANLQNNGQKTAADLHGTLKKESERDAILPRPQIKKPSKYPLFPNYEFDDTPFYTRKQIIIKEKRQDKIIYIRIEETSPWCFQPIATPIVAYKTQDAKREDDRDQSHNFSLLVDSYISAGAYLDLQSKNDSKIARLLKLIKLKITTEDRFAVILKGKICDKLHCEDTRIPELLETQGVHGAFVYLFDKKTKTCLHRQFQSVKKENEKEFHECFKYLEDQGQDMIRGYSIDPRITPACLFSS